MLLAVPNVSEGRNHAVLDAIGAAFTDAGASLLDVSSDPDHHRTVFTLESPAGGLAEAVAAGAAVAIERIDLRLHDGVHPRIGAVDVAPIVYRSAAQRGAAVAEAIVLAELLGSLGTPVFLYGQLAGGRTRAEIRQAPSRFTPDYGPPDLHPSAGGTLVAARPPLIAFNVEIDGTLEQARTIAAAVRRLPGVRALGLELASQGIVQVSTNVEEPDTTSPADVVAAVRALAPVIAAELVAPAPAAAFAGFPRDVPLKGADKAIL